VKTDEKVALMLGGAVALVGGAWWWSEEHEGEGFLDMVTDYLSLLTSSEAERMEQLEPETQSRLRDLIFALGAEGIRVYVGQTLRTAAQEKALIEAGRTSATLVHSWHELGRAVDLYPIDPDTGKPDLKGRRIDLFQAMHARAKELGFRGIAFEEDGVTKKYIKGKKGLVWDAGHLECRGPYATMAQAWAAEGPRTA
jgi:hypothetical protein